MQRISEEGTLNKNRCLSLPVAVQTRYDKSNISRRCHARKDTMQEIRVLLPIISTLFIQRMPLSNCSTQRNRMKRHQRHNRILRCPYSQLVSIWLDRSRWLLWSQLLTSILQHYLGMAEQSRIEQNRIEQGRIYYWRNMMS